MPEEIWKPVIGFDDYEVSNLGRVRSHKQNTARILKPTPQRSGHLQLWLRRDGKTVPVRVHRLVLEAFVSPCPDGCVGTHKDDDPSNNLLENLEWNTQSNNIRQCVANGRRTQPNPTPTPGLLHWGHKLTKEQVLAIRNDNRSYSAIAKDYGIGTMTAYRCKKRISYKDV
jgi:hypothetical protein